MHKAKNRKPIEAADTYMDLIRRFPLKRIKNVGEHERACAMVSELMGRKLDSGAGDYLDALIILVATYEDENHKIGDDVTPREALRALMEANDLSQADIGRLIGSESAVSMFLKGQRGLSKMQIKTLAERFKVDASIFLD